MAAVLLAGLAAAVSCALARLKVWALVPVVIVFLIITIIKVVTGFGFGTTAPTFFIGSALFAGLRLRWIADLAGIKEAVSAPMPSRSEFLRFVHQQSASK